MLVDSHCHLNYPGLVDDRAGVLARARAAGVGGLLGIATRRADWAEVIAATGRADGEPDVWAAIGIHPHVTDDHPDTGTAQLVDAAKHPRVIGIGETGLDYYYDKSERGRQQASFRDHIAAARTTGLPLIIHTRDAEDDTLAILREGARGGALTGVIHCFTASRAFADAALALGFHISLSGIVTFRNAQDIQETARAVPADRLLVETDAPYLAPVPMRGRPCEPAFVAHTAAFVAGLRGVEPSALAATTTANFFRLFTKARPACG